MTSWLQIEACMSGTRASFIRVALLPVLVMAMSGCDTKEPKSLSLTGIVYNYTDSAIAAVSVNGRNVSAVMDGVEPGGVTGGAGVCCAEIVDGAREAQVEVDLGDTKYTAKASVEKWWPDLAHYAVVHVLPGKKVVMQITPSFPAPRKDLLEAQQMALGQPVQVKFKVWSAGPIERIEGEAQAK